MPTGPGPHLLQDPRFDEVFRKALARHGLADVFGDTVRKLVAGDADPRSFQCCDTGCEPCVKDYLGAAEMILRTLAPAPVPAPKRRRFWFF